MPSRNGTAPTLEGVDVSDIRILSVEDILSVDDLPEEVVPVPEWNGHVRIKGFSKQKQMAIREEAGGIGDGFDISKFEMLVFVYGVIDPQFTSEQMGVLKDKSAMVVDRILARIMELAGLTEEAREAAKATFPKIV